MHTLQIEHATLFALFSFLTLGNALLHRDTRGAFWFPTYNICCFLGATLIALRGTIPFSLSVLSAGLFPLAFLFLHRSLTDFFGKEAFQWRLQNFLVVYAFSVLIVYGILQPDTRQRLQLYSFILFTQLGLSAWFVFKNVSGPARLSGWLMGIVLALLGLSNLVRALGVFFFGAPSDYSRGSVLLDWTLLNNTVLEGGITVAFVWMTTAVLSQDLRVQALTDPLTGLLNRRAVELAADREITVSRHTHKPLCAVLVDLDGFKQINDLFGHSVGDTALIAAARCLQHGMRQSDRLARLGGDEFVILLPDTRLDTAMEIAERLRSNLEHCDFAQGPAERRLCASFGVAQLQDTAYKWDHLIMSCDKALYTVKGRGGNLVVTQ